MTTSKKMYLESMDGKMYEVDPALFVTSKVIQILMKSSTDDKHYGPWPLKIKSNILDKMLKWLEHHKDNLDVKDLSEWDDQFLHPLSSETYQLMSAAHYLDIPGLLLVIARALAECLGNQSAREDDDNKSDLESGRPN